MSANLTRRFLSYLIDVLILGILISFTLKLFHSNLASINRLETFVSDLNALFLEGKISLGEYIKGYSSYSQDLDRIDLIPSVINFIYVTVLFIYIPFFFKGQTIGQKFLEIKIVKDSGKKATLVDSFVKALIFYSLGYLIITISTVYLLPSLPYFYITFILNFLEIFLVIISGFMILYRHDQKALIDLLTKTKVVKV